MLFALKKLSKHGFNHRALSEEDLLHICESEDITVLYLDVPTSFYFSVRNKYFIVLKKSLKGLRRTFALAHELAHHFLHGGKDTANAFFFGLIESRNEFEADAMATIALVPRFMLNSYDFLEEHPNRYARQLFKNRQKLEFLYGI